MERCPVQAMSLANITVKLSIGVFFTRLRKQEMYRMVVAYVI